MADTFFLRSGTAVRNHTMGTEAADALFDRLRASVPDVLYDSYQAIGDEYTHEVLGSRVIRTCLLAQDGIDLVGKAPASCHRLFELESGCSFFYTTDLFVDDKPPCMGPKSFIIAKTSHFEEFGRPCRPEMLSFSELFFIAPIEELNGFYGLQVESIQPNTLFSALVADGQIRSVRRYWSDTDALMTNWQGVYVYFARKEGRIDLARQVMNLPYLEQYC